MWAAKCACLVRVFYHEMRYSVMVMGVNYKSERGMVIVSSNVSARCYDAWGLMDLDCFWLKENTIVMYSSEKPAPLNNFIDKIYDLATPCLLRGERSVDCLLLQSCVCLPFTCSSYCIFMTSRDKQE